MPWCHYRKGMPRPGCFKVAPESTDKINFKCKTSNNLGMQVCVGSEVAFEGKKWLLLVEAWKLYKKKFVS